MYEYCFTIMAIRKKVLAVADALDPRAEVGLGNEPTVLLEQTSQAAMDL